MNTLIATLPTSLPTDAESWKNIFGTIVEILIAAMGAWFMLRRNWAQRQAEQQQQMNEIKESVVSTKADVKTVAVATDQIVRAADPQDTMSKVDSTVHADVIAIAEKPPTIEPPK